MAKLHRIRQTRAHTTTKVPKNARKPDLYTYFTEEEIDYLFKLIDNEMFPTVMSPHKNATVDALLKHQDMIQKEKPAPLKKIEEWIGISAKEFKASRSSFSYNIIRWKDFLLDNVYNKH